MGPHARIVEPGFFTTMQDLGRPGLGSIGVPRGGAADGLSLRIANRVVGNMEGEAALEMTIIGATIEFPVGAMTALAGAACDAVIVDRSGARRSIAPCAPQRVQAGEVVRVGPLRTGARTYLAIQGGLSVEPALASRGTYVPGGFGGLDGRALRKDDRLPLGEALGLRTSPAPSEVVAFVKAAAERRVVRALPGSGSERFGPAAAAFWEASFTVSPRSDRVGLRLAGSSIESPDDGAMASEGMAHGFVQVPPGGEPIVLMADHPTTGGYPVIACVATVDLPTLGQLRPGDGVRFERVSQSDALALLRKRENVVRAWESAS